jgi:hypothetical protein
VWHLAPGCWSGPLLTRIFTFSMLWIDTVSGNVMLKAIDLGTPTWYRNHIRV